MDKRMAWYLPRGVLASEAEIGIAYPMKIEDGRGDAVIWQSLLLCQWKIQIYLTLTAPAI